MRPTIICLIAGIAALMFAFDAVGADTATVKTGVMQFEATGIESSSSGSSTGVSRAARFNVSNLTIQWSHFPKTNLGIYGNYRTAIDPSIGRTMYMEGSGGIRYFPWTLGVPIVSTSQSASFQYDSWVKPYIEGGIGIGWYLIKTFEEFGALEISSEFYAIGLGLGAAFTLTKSMALDISIALEKMSGYGPVPFSGSGKFATLGVIYFF